jgi:hypothetical protein
MTNVSAGYPGECLECGAQIFPEWARPHFESEHPPPEYEHGAVERVPPEGAD